MLKMYSLYFSLKKIASAWTFFQSLQSYVFNWNIVVIWSILHFGNKWKRKQFSSLKWLDCRPHFLLIVIINVPAHTRIICILIKIEASFPENFGVDGTLFLFLIFWWSRFKLFGMKEDGEEKIRAGFFERVFRLMRKVLVAIFAIIHKNTTFM